MADEPKVNETPPVAPAFDAEALGKTISDAVATQVKTALAEVPQAREPEVHQPTDALEEVLQPYVTKATNRATMIALLAADKADFYAVDDPEVLAERLHFKDEIEKRTMGLAQTGRALPRKDVFAHLKGEEEAKIQEFRGKRRKAREDAARGAEDFGGGPMPREGGLPRVLSADHAYELQGAGKLDEALAGKEF